MNGTQRSVDMLADLIADSAAIHLYLVVGVFGGAVFCYLIFQTVRHGFALRPAMPSVARLTLFLLIVVGVSMAMQVIWSVGVWSLSDWGRVAHFSDPYMSHHPFFEIPKWEPHAESTWRRGSSSAAPLPLFALYWGVSTLGVWQLSLWIYRRLRPNVPGVESMASIS